MLKGRIAQLRFTFAVAVLCAFTVCAKARTGPNTGHDIWKSTVGDFSIRWTKQDILVTRAGATVLSFQAIAQSDWNKISQPAADQPMQSERSYRILSAVGPVLSVEQSDNCDCGGAHPAASKRFRAFDLSKTSPENPAPAKLTDIFPEESVLAALRDDKLVAGALKDVEGQAPASLPELVSAIQFKSVQVKECSYNFGPDLLGDFAFYAVEGNKVAVRISLSHAAEVCRGQMTQIGILLPIPESFKTAIQSAQTGKAGILMEQATRTLGKTETSFTFATKSYGK